MGFGASVSFQLSLSIKRTGPSLDHFAQLFPKGWNKPTGQDKFNHLLRICQEVHMQDTDLEIDSKIIQFFSYRVLP